MNDSEARKILREHGEEPPKRGQLGPEWKAKATHYADQEAAEINGRADTGASYDGSVTEADFPPGDLPDPPAELAGPGEGEQKPRRVKTKAKARGGSLSGLLRGRQSDGGSSTGPRAPRVPVDRLVSRGWEMLAGLAARVDPPLGRCLDMQAPVAGLILEDVVRGTAVDRVLQPVARAEEKAEKVLALAAPPMIVLGLEAAQALPEDQRRMREAILLPLLQESLVLWVKIAGDKVDERMAREEEEAPAREKAAQLIQMMFAPPAGAAMPDQETAAA